ncbi:metal-sensitive transcriptional regulator [Dermacoccaceae bacterium W4C1]
MTPQASSTPGTDAPAAKADTHSAHHGYISDKDRYLARLKRIEGQARGIHRMVDEDVYCIDILTQISALNSALENVALALLEDHLKHCVVNAAQAGGEEADAKIAEATAAISRLVKS